VNSVEKVKVNSDYTIKLPVKIRKLVNPEDELFLSLVDNTIKLKTVNKSGILGLAEKTEDESKLAIEEINKIVHKVRRISRCE